jgi:4-hydroxybenzoate polyprenyltransferase
VNYQNFALGMTLPQSGGAAATHDVAVPLCVDLDGTLICSDLLWESFLLLAREHPFAACGAIFCWPDRARLKRYLATRVALDPAALPYHEEFLAWLRGQHAAGRRLVLVTASDEILAQRVAGYLGIFERVIASDGYRNLKSTAKAAALLEEYPQGYDYVGNSTADLAVWEKARGAVAVGASPRVLRQLPKSQIEAVFPISARSRLRVWAKALRVHQWAKNLLVFVPILTSHRWGDRAACVSAVWMFAAFSFCASSTYLLNDLLDLPADRKHPRKRHRPFASGALSVPAGIAAGAAALLGGLMLAYADGPAAVLLAGLYAALSISYSLEVKKHAPADVFFLAGLYVLRIIGGGVAAGIHLTEWLLAFALFLFLGLAFCKRSAELAAMKEAGMEAPAGRDYTIADAPLVMGCGIAAACTATLVLVLYLNSDQVRIMYRDPTALWLLAPLILFWQVRLWMLTVRGRMRDDPILFTIRDPTTWLIGLAAMALIVIAK